MVGLTSHTAVLFGAKFKLVFDKEHGKAYKGQSSLPNVNTGLGMDLVVVFLKSFEIENLRGTYKI